MSTKEYFSSYNSIEQFRNVMRDLKKAKKNPMFQIPDKIEFTGTIKLHGTNAGVCFNKKVGLFCQSRNNIITITQDNQGFAFFVEKNKDKFMEFFSLLQNKYDIDLDTFTLSIYGEWCGENIQKGVALTKLPKCFCIFDCKVSNHFDPSFKSYWLDISFKQSDQTTISFPEAKIYNIYDFQTFQLEVEVDKYGDAQQYLTQVTESVEKCCPFAKQLGVEGIGEGVVWRYCYGNNRTIFKTKGEEHKVTKEKVLIPVDAEKVENIQDFVEKTCTQNRFDQALDTIYKINPESKLYGQAPKIKDCEIILNWIRDDILKEEMTTLVENNLDLRDVTPCLYKKVITMIKTLI